ncbi:NrsF family protein [Novosphingobium sp.]|uniref:NrsF family protein n=1 Tax=Novosphingobium sp. TaxID=1874826 RepID=UPI003BAC6012
MPSDRDDPTIDQTIAALVGDLTPVAPLRVWRGVAAGLFLTALAVLAVWLVLGLRADVLALHPAPIVIARGAILLAGGFAMLVAALRAGVPGRADGGAMLAGTVLLGLLPISLMGLLLNSIVAGKRMPFEEAAPFEIARCFAVALVSALLVGAGLVLWLRRAAPTDLARSGWLTGWAAAALGTFAYSLFCPSGTMAFAAVVYPAAMLLAATAIRFAVPPLLRW